MHREDDTRQTARHLRRAAVLIAGGSILLVGMALLVLPGPGLLIIFAGLSLLATEFPWAVSLLLRARRTARRSRRRARTVGTAQARAEHR